MKNLIILVGNIGSGKSTYSKLLAKQGYKVLSRDAIRYMCGAGEYLFDVELEYTIQQGFNALVKYFISDWHDIVIDETNMSIEMRKHYLSMANRFAYKITAIVMPKLTKLKSVERRLQSNHGNTSKEIWETVWEKFDKMYDSPTIKEGFNKVIHLRKGK